MHKDTKLLLMKVYEIDRIKHTDFFKLAWRLGVRFSRALSLFNLLRAAKALKMGVDGMLYVDRRLVRRYIEYSDEPMRVIRKHVIRSIIRELLDDIGMPELESEASSLIDAIFSNRKTRYLFTRDYGDYVAAAVAIALAGVRTGKRVPTGRLARLVEYGPTELRSLITDIAKKLGIRPTQPSLEQIVGYIAGRLSLPSEVVDDALRILSMAREAGYTHGKNPWVLAATAIALACKRRNCGLGRMRIAASAGVSDEIVKKRERELSKLLLV